MFKVQLRDANDPSKVLVSTFDLPYDPHDGCEIRVRRRAGDDKHTSYRIVRHGLYEAVIGDPHASGFTLLVQPI